MRLKKYSHQFCPQIKNVIGVWEGCWGRQVSSWLCTLPETNDYLEKVKNTHVHIGHLWQKYRGGGAKDRFYFLLFPRKPNLQLQVKLRARSKTCTPVCWNANTKHMLTPACVHCWLTSCQRRRVFCTRLNCLIRWDIFFTSAVGSWSDANMFSPPQRQSAGGDKLLHSASPCCASRFSVTAAVYSPPPPPPALLHHPVCKPPGYES